VDCALIPALPRQLLTHRSYNRVVAELLNYLRGDAPRTGLQRRVDKAPSSTAKAFAAHSPTHHEPATQVANVGMLETTGVY
jgi:hypothetical protein